MQNTVRVIREIKAPAAWVWEIISLAGGVDQWMPSVEDCRLEGRGVGAHRLCKTHLGWVREVIEVIEHTERRFEYSVSGQGLLPFKYFLGTMQVVDIDGECSLVIWRGQFELVAGEVEDVRRLVRGLFHSGIEGLEKYWSEQVRAVA